MHKIAIIGYGKMGKTIESVVSTAGRDQVIAIIDNENDWKQQYNALQQCDVAIEFSTPATACENVIRCLEWRLPIVCGTTGWYDQLDKVLDVARLHDAPFIYGSNFNIGVNLFFLLNETFAQWTKKMPYEVAIKEIHHEQKIDIPSGTAKTLCELIVNQWDNEQYASPVSSSGYAWEKQQPVIRAHRVKNDVKGIHSAVYSSEEDVITLTHIAKNRTGFAHGAMNAAHWLLTNRGIYHFKDIFLQMINL